MRKTFAGCGGAVTVFGEIGVSETNTSGVYIENAIYDLAYVCKYLPAVYKVLVYGGAVGYVIVETS